MPRRIVSTKAEQRVHFNAAGSFKFDAPAARLCVTGLCNC
jgi:hypothetical protein